MHLMSIRLGTSDTKKARTFYDSTFAALGADPTPSPEDAKTLVYRHPGSPVFMIGTPRDGEPACHANGGTILFSADSDDAVRAWHAAGLANGGSNEGDAEPKPQVNGLWGAYLRDPDGNKLGCFHGLSFG